ncbi:hypothetical protein QLH52_04580 [Methylomonas sp. OY6]|uniref:ABC transporter family protein n=1 Tax=Methylomonas defluvii TaxID=3045149 RepID=A0ABU4UAT4_9GAMM|nr:hypothetical protein [Methylomonas sp. OY6]MDX8126545.1 hypothetical protein [Methylomonas sp. OY6]
MLQACQLTKSCDSNCTRHALNRHVALSRIFCLLGANGAGNTSTISLFLNFIAASSGTAKIGGFVVSGGTEQTRRLLA